LDGRGLFKSSLKDSHHKLALDIKIFKFEAFCGGNILFSQLVSSSTPVKITGDEPRFVVGHLSGEDSVCPVASAR
jgi:hypothetical protein